MKVGKKYRNISMSFFTTDYHYSIGYTVVDIGYLLENQIRAYQIFIEINILLNGFPSATLMEFPRNIGKPYHRSLRNKTFN